MKEIEVNVVEEVADLEPPPIVNTLFDNVQWSEPDMRQVLGRINRPSTHFLPHQRRVLTERWDNDLISRTFWGE